MLLYPLYTWLRLHFIYIHVYVYTPEVFVCPLVFDVLQSPNFCSGHQIPPLSYNVYTYISCIQVMYEEIRSCIHSQLMGPN